MCTRKQMMIKMVEAQKLSFFSDLCNMTSACAWNAVHSIFFIRIQDITLYLPCEPKKKTNRRKSASDKQRKHTFTKNIILILRQESISAIQSSGIITHKFSDAHSYALSITLETCLCFASFPRFPTISNVYFQRTYLVRQSFWFSLAKNFSLF